ncbi:ADP-ribosylglycohydrolase family protein [[Actinomadura] parvosata]|uniref:ADP-ribosylglycohydrolase family protein n=1 Tax=[Actinomadura] parvosata TaxID=1955412 RepID=UPI00406D11E2
MATATNLHLLGESAPGLETGQSRTDIVIPSLGDQGLAFGLGMSSAQQRIHSARHRIPQVQLRDLDRISEHVPASLVRDGVEEARRLLTVSDPLLAARALGNGRQVAAHDTVPFTLWVAARHRHDYEAALWTTAAAGGDIDTTCAIVGGIVAAAEGIRLPPRWKSRCEPLPDWAEAPALHR